MSETPADRLRRARVGAGHGTIRSAWLACRRHDNDLNYNTYKSHDNGQRGFSEDDAKTYAKAFKVSHVWLLTGVDPQQPFSPEEAELLSDFRALDEATRNQARAILRALLRPSRLPA